MENEYARFAQQYSEMKTQINNDSLIAQLDKEQHLATKLLVYPVQRIYFMHIASQDAAQRGQFFFQT